MSGHSDSEPCPVCGGNIDCYSDWKPVQYVSGNCLDCGFYYDTQYSRMNLEDLNNERTERELEELNALPVIDDIHVRRWNIPKGGSNESEEETIQTDNHAQGAVGLEF